MFLKYSVISEQFTEKDTKMFLKYSVISEQFIEKDTKMASFEFLKYSAVISKQLKGHCCQIPFQGGT